MPPPRGDKQEYLKEGARVLKKEWPSQFQLPIKLHPLDEMDMEMSLVDTSHKLIGRRLHMRQKTACAERVGNVDL